MSDVNLPTPRKIGFARLALINWMLESPNIRFAMKYNGSYGNSDLVLYEYDGEKLNELASYFVSDARAIELEDRLGGSRAIDTTMLERVQLLNHYKDFASARDGGENNFDKFCKKVGMQNQDVRENKGIIVCNKKTVEWWKSTGRAAFEKMKEKRDDERAAVERTILIGAECIIYPPSQLENGLCLPKGMKNPIPALNILRPTFTARVIRETETKVFVTDVARIRDEDKKYNSSSERDPIRGRAPNNFVSREHIMVDNVNSKIIAAMNEIDSDEVESYSSAGMNALSEVLGPLISMNDRLFQSESRRADLIREAIENNATHDNDDDSCPSM